MPAPRLPAGPRLLVRHTLARAGVLVVTASGTVDGSTAWLLQRALWRDLPAKTVIDLSEVPVLGLAGVRVLEGAAARARAERRGIAIVARSLPVVRVLRLFALDTRVPVHARLSDAVGAGRGC
ncbi:MULTISPECIES: STAS domain-containing protein [unclassified Amycolatopsis]|uniref:STAS domain-containing protein n=1 Tax=unclassified Amycolatopsis TaxID=2618356 RepID=UPI002E20E8F8|nr:MULTISPECIES: STAS domain-containing protein [unclassified Amycolatopsis]